jgi:hypothetical protein
VETLSKVDFLLSLSIKENYARQNIIVCIFMFFFVLAAIDIKSEEVSINRQRGAF